MGNTKSRRNISPEDLEFLSKNTSYDQNTIKQWYKGFIKDCPTGELTPEQFVKTYQLFFPSGKADQFCDHVFRTFDRDKNGLIDFREFMLAIGVTSGGSLEEKLKWAFGLYDVDGDGIVEQREMENLMMSIHDMMGTGEVKDKGKAVERAREVFAKMDSDNDGKITQQEFLRGCLEDRSLAKLLAPNVDI